MGKRGPLPQPGRPRSRHRDDAAVAVVPSPTTAAVTPDIPPPPSGLLPSSVSTWADFWTSRPASWVDRGAAMSALVRWIRDVDLYERLLDDLTPRQPMPRPDDWEHEDWPVSPVPGVFDARRPWLGKGSTEQIKRHPTAELLDEVAARIHRAEVEFGMTPYAGVRLGLAGVQGALTAEQLNRLVDERTRRSADPDPDASWAEGFELV